MSSLYEKKIDCLKNIGPAKSELFNKLGISSVGELIRYYPTSYLDLTKPVTVSQAVAGNLCCIKATITTEPITRTSFSGVLLTSCIAIDKTGYIKIVYFNNRYITNKLIKGKELCFFGKVTFESEFIQMTSPEIFEVSDIGKLFPNYHLTKGLTNRIISNAVKQSLTMLPENVKDPIPKEIREKYKLCDLKKALINIHFPKSQQDYMSAHYRLIFEKMLVLNLGLSLYKIEGRKAQSPIIEKDYNDEYFSKLSFEPTNAQKRAVKECFNDMSSGKYAMSRLLQGDVGCGKTAVAGALCYTVVKNGGQAAFMAPTEILAEQHFYNLSKILSDTNIKICLLKGSLKKKEKDILYKKISSGEIDIIIGTHAILSENVIFKNLVFIVTDEQHRFGVRQRTKLINKGENPHLLVMSATPIPRTLGLIIYGDLDITIIDELPLSRKPIKTCKIDNNMRDKAYTFIKGQLVKGKQCYIICPNVEENENNLESVEKYQEAHFKYEFKDFKIGVLHGKLNTNEKDNIMRQFKDGNIDILIATTVVEVGVDVPNATVIMIENAERFGLSQLHQLRGRVGRGDSQSYCILLTDSKTADCEFRMNTMLNTTNGFDIADADLKLRGPGEFFGDKQSGLSEISQIAIKDINIINDSKKAAEEIVKTKNGIFEPEYRTLRAEIHRIFNKYDERLN